jgi:hypothetical protein
MKRVLGIINRLMYSNTLYVQASLLCHLLCAVIPCCPFFAFSAPIYCAPGLNLPRYAVFWFRRPERRGEKKNNKERLQGVLLQMNCAKERSSNLGNLLSKYRISFQYNVRTGVSSTFRTVLMMCAPGLRRENEPVFLLVADLLFDVCVL